MGYEGKTIENVPVLDEIIKLRRELASILEFDTFADYVLDIKMAKNTKNVNEFLADLREKLTPLGQAERKKLLALKKEVHEKRGLPADDSFNLWDYRYYDRLWTERELALEDEKVKEYFPVDKVVPTILDIYRKMLSVQFYPISSDQVEGDMKWHPETEAYAVWDHQDGKDGDFLGYMYLDLFVSI
jgi:Zn-dependent oligopeptidase